MVLSVVGVVCALASEARHLGPTVQMGAHFGSLSDGTLVATTGMGCAAASTGAQALVDAGATALASWGMAGGLDPSLNAGAILLPTEVIGPDGRTHMTEAGWRIRVSAAVASHAPVRAGKLLTTLKAIGSVQEKADLFSRTGAAAVDMESSAVGEVAEQNRLPFLAVRVVVDSAADTLPCAVTAAADREGRIQIWKLIGALALAPNELAPLIRLARRYRAANRSLAAIGQMGRLTSNLS